MGLDAPPSRCPNWSPPSRAAVCRLVHKLTAHVHRPSGVRHSIRKSGETCEISRPALLDALNILLAFVHDFLRLRVKSDKINRLWQPGTVEIFETFRGGGAASHE